MLPRLRAARLLSSVHGYHAAKGRVYLAQLGIGGGFYLRVAHFLLKRRKHVKYQVGVRPALDHAEIVYAEARVDLLHFQPHQPARRVYLSVVGNDGVKVYRCRKVKLVAKALFDVVDEIVRFEYVCRAVHLHVQRCYRSAGTVAVDHKVVDAENTVI